MKREVVVEVDEGWRKLKMAEKENNRDEEEDERKREEGRRRMVVVLFVEARHGSCVVSLLRRNNKIT